MSRAEELALEKYPQKDARVFITASGHSITVDKNREAREAYKEGFEDGFLDGSKTNAFKSGANFVAYNTIRGIISIGFMHFLDEHRPDDKMCLSNGECMDIEKAFEEQDWLKLERYLKKYTLTIRPKGD